MWKLWCVLSLWFKIGGGKSFPHKMLFQNTDLQALQEPAQTSRRFGGGQCWLQWLDTLSGGFFRWDAYNAIHSLHQKKSQDYFFQMSSEPLLSHFLKCIIMILAHVRGVNRVLKCFWWAFNKIPFVSDLVMFFNLMLLKSVGEPDGRHQGGTTRFVAWPTKTHIWGLADSLFHFHFSVFSPPRQPVLFLQENEGRP